MILVLVLALAGCSSGALGQAQPTQAIISSATPITHPANARATTITREIPAPLLSKDPESAVTITRTSDNAISSAASATPSASAIPLTPTPTRLPLLTSDLLFLTPNSTDQSSLQRWDYVTGYASLLVENVVMFLPSASGKLIVLLRPHHVSANGQALYDVDMLDYENMQTWPILEQIPRPNNLAISPDGQWIVYQENTERGIIHAVRTDTPKHQVELGECDPGSGATPNQDLLCSQLAWSPDSRQVVWSDAQGLWISAPLQPTATHIHKPQVSVSDPKGNITEMQVTLHNITWSPIGRFITVQVTPSLDGVHWLAVVDTRLGRMANIPQSSEYNARILSVNWTQSGSLVVAHGGDGSQPFVKIWDVLPTNTDLVVPKRAFELNRSEILAEAQTTATYNTETQTEGVSCLTWFSEHSENSWILGMAFTGGQKPIAPVLLTLNLIDGRAKKLIDLPLDTQRVLWSPDGSGALILGGEGNLNQPKPIMFFTLRDNRLVNLQDAISAGAHDFLWLSPAPRR